MHHLTVLLFLFAALTAAAQDAIIVPPLTQGERGTVVRISVSGTISQTGTSQVALTYPADVIRIIAVEGGEQYAYHCPSMPIYGTSVDAPATGRLTFQCEEVVATSNGELFVVVAEFLRGPGTIGPMQATSLVLNGTQAGNATFTSGNVEALGTPLQYQSSEGFTGNYPNPFAINSDFVFQMERAGTVRLVVLNTQGRQVLDLGSVDATAGENTYMFQPEGWELAQGAYLMQLVTDRGVYLHPFVVVK